MFSQVNFAFLVLSSFAMWVTYMLSLAPKKTEITRGKHAWTRAAVFRNLSNACEMVMIATMVLMVWFPLPDIWLPIFPSGLPGWIVGILLAIPFAYMDYRGIKDGGKETFMPQATGKLCKEGIYKHIRHPQMIGENPLFICGSICLNSWLLVAWWTLFFMLYFPTIIHLEERDLQRRFGDEYMEYKKNTGAIFPKFWRRNAG